ncbi:hypothetical protein CFP56_011965 [Quercus suber]|uniref:Uncharacterized protein n=1 Tax=Quercus suber TaxID=58331 RepID=A0AAW0KXW3_QUESU
MESSSWPWEDDNKPYINADWRGFRAKLVAGEGATRSQAQEPPSHVVDPDIVVDYPLPLPITIGDKWAHILHEPEKGCLLIATEKLDALESRPIVCFINCRKLLQLPYVDYIISGLRSSHGSFPQKKI